MAPGRGLALRPRLLTQFEGLTDGCKALVGEKVGEQAAGAAVAQGVALAALHAGVVTIGRHVTSEYTDRMKRWAHHKGALPSRLRCSTAWRRRRKSTRATYSSNHPSKSHVQECGGYPPWGDDSDNLHVRAC